MSGPVVHTFRTKDGQQLWVRPLRADDAHHLVDLFEHMGSESRYLRFNVSLNNLDPAVVWSEAKRLAVVDPSRDGGWLAFADLPAGPETPVAGVRYVRVSDDVAEASLVVRDDMQNQGVGTELLRFLVTQAQKAGIREMRATVQRINRPLWHLLRRSGLDITYESEGSLTNISVRLPEPESVE
ncbi:MAG: N-acetyltransferase family protein [Candidatus Promineifilaceae bacterium]